MIDIRINHGSHWNVELIESQCINVSPYRPLSGSFYINFPVELRSLKKAGIKIKNNHQKFFFNFSCYINTSKTHRQSP